jgi:hypothetical protein
MPNLKTVPFAVSKKKHVDRFDIPIMRSFYDRAKTHEDQQTRITYNYTLANHVEKQVIRKFSTE